MNKKFEEIRPTVLEIYYLLDMDGTMLDSKGDWSIKSLIPENLCNIDMVYEIAKEEEDEFYHVFGAIYSGRGKEQASRIRSLFLQKRIKFKSINTRQWELPLPMNENQFYLRYWNDKHRYALALKELKEKIAQVEIWEDDTVLCEMARRCKINCVQFQDCEIIREDRF